MEKAPTAEKLRLVRAAAKCVLFRGTNPGTPFWSARATLAGIELWRMLKKNQGKSSLPAWEQFYALGATGKLRLENTVRWRF